MSSCPAWVGGSWPSESAHAFPACRSCSCPGIPPIRPSTSLAVVGAGCTESVTSPSGEAPFAQTDLVAGTGASAINGSTVTVHYTGWLYRESATDKKGLQFETSAGLEPFVFTVGVGAVIAGWD